MSDTMTKKDFEELALALKTARNNCEVDTVALTDAAFNIFVYHVGLACGGGMNPKFNYDKFRTACGVRNDRASKLIDLSLTKVKPNASS